MAPLIKGAEKRDNIIGEREIYGVKRPVWLLLQVKEFHNTLDNTTKIGDR